MNVQLGIYEIFSTIIPGFVYLTAICQFLVLTNTLSINWNTINGVSLVSAIFLLVVAYLLGVVFGRFGLLWYKIFRKKDQSLDLLEKFKQRHLARWNIDFANHEWHVLLAFLRSRNLDLARENERHLAASIMLRNVSFGFFLLAVINIGQVFWIGNVALLILGSGLLILSFLTIYESMKFRRWYYDSVLSSVLAYRIELEKSITPAKPAATQTKRKNRKTETQL